MSRLNSFSKNETMNMNNIKKSNGEIKEHVPLLINSNKLPLLISERHKIVEKINKFKLPLNKEKLVSKIREKFLGIPKNEEINRSNIITDRHNSVNNSFTTSRKIRFKNCFSYDMSPISPGYFLKNDAFTSPSISKNASIMKILSPNYGTKINNETSNLNIESYTNYKPIDKNNQFHVRINIPQTLKNKRTNKNVFLQKKILKGKLLNAMNKSIVMDDKSIEQFKTEKTSIIQNFPQKNAIKIRNILKLGITTNKSPELLLPKPDFYTSRVEDIYETPNQLVSKKNFNEKEIELMKSDPHYFKINKGKFKEISLLQSKSLLDIILKEERSKANDLNRNKKEIINDLKISIENSIEKAEKFVKGEAITNKEERKRSIVKNLYANNHKLYKTIILSHDNKIKQYTSNTARKEYQSIQNHFEMKLKSYVERKKMKIDSNIDQIIKKNRGKSQSFRLNKSKKDEEIKVTKDFVNRIKDNYMNK